MKFENFEVFAAVICSWLLGFLLSLWHPIPYITDREAGLIIALSAVVFMVIIYQELNRDAVIAYLSRHAGEVHNMMLIDLQELHRKRIATLKANHNQATREAQDEIRRLHIKFDRLHSEHDWISTIYQDQMRSTQEQEDRINFLEVKLKEFGQLTPSAAPAPFSAPAYQINFANPPRRVRGTARVSSPLSQAPLVQVQETEEE